MIHSFGKSATISKEIHLLGTYTGLRFACEPRNAPHQLKVELAQIAPAVHLLMHARVSNSLSQSYS